MICRYKDSEETHLVLVKDLTNDKLLTLRYRPVHDEPSYSDSDKESQISTTTAVFHHVPETAVTDEEESYGAKIDALSSTSSLNEACASTYDEGRVHFHSSHRYLDCTCKAPFDLHNQTIYQVFASITNPIDVDLRKASPGNAPWIEHVDDVTATETWT